MSVASAARSPCVRPAHVELVPHRFPRRSFLPNGLECSQRFGPFNCPRVAAPETVDFMDAEAVNPIQLDIYTRLGSDEAKERR